MTSLELLQEIDAWLSFNNSPSKEQISELRDDIKKHISEQLNIHNVSVRDFIVGDVVCTQDGRIWVINEIDGDDLLVDGNGRRNCPLEKSDVSHVH